MLPRETTVKQLKRLRQETKGTDIGDLTSNDRLNHNVPNLQYIGNPVDTGIESWEEFSTKDSQLQTIAFKSKLVNKPLVKKGLEPENESKNMENIVENFNDFKPQGSVTLGQNKSKGIWQSDKDGWKCKTCGTLVSKNGELICDCDQEEIKEYHNPEYQPTVLKPSEFDEYLERKKKSKKEKKEKKEKIEEAKKEKSTEEPSNPNFGYAAVRDQQIKKIAFFNNFGTIDPPTPKERPILNAGQFVNTDEVRGYINRIEGDKVFVESLDEPMKIVEIKLKDAVKPPKPQEETIKKFNEIVDELNKEFLKDK